MFKKDIKDLKSEALKALDVLQLSLNIDDLIRFQSNQLQAKEILASLAKSPDLFFKFFEWLETLGHQTSNSSFSLSIELTKKLPHENWLDFNNPKLSELRSKCDPHKLHHYLKLSLYKNLPNWFLTQLQNSELRTRSERTCLNEAAKCIEESIYHKNSLSKTQSNINKSDITGLRPIFIQACKSGFQNISKKVIRYIDQHLGQKGVLKFINHVREKFSFYSILHLERGINGSQLHHLNTHIKLCVESCRLFTDHFHNTHNKIKLNHGKLIPFTFLHELGLALLYSQGSNLEHSITERFSSTCVQEKITLTKYREHEINVFHDSQLSRLSEKLSEIDFNLLSQRLSQHKEIADLIQYPHQYRALAKAYLSQFLKYKKISEQPKWIQCLLEIINPEALDDWTPIQHRGHLAAEFLNYHCEDHEMVRGAYQSYADFLLLFHSNLPYTQHSLESLVVLWSKHLTFRLSQHFDFNTPFHHLDLDEEKLEQLTQELSKRLGINKDQLIELGKATIHNLKEQLANIIPNSQYQSHSNDVFFKTNHLKDHYYQQLNKFFNESKHFNGGLNRFHVWTNHLHHIFNSSLMEKGYDFFGELENDLRKFCRVMDVKIKPRFLLNHENIQDYFSYLFDEDDFGEELFCLQYRHLIADVYILDSKAEQLFDRECTIFLELTFNYLLIQYSQEIWELLKTNSEIARREIAKDIQYHLPKDQLNTALLSLKAKLLDELFNRFDPLTENKMIQYIHFGISNVSSDFKLIVTEDFQYWASSTSTQNQQEDHLAQIEQCVQEQLNRVSQQNNAPHFYSFKTKAHKTYHLCRFVDFNDSEETVLWILAQQVNELNFKQVLETFHDKGIALDLTRYNISQNQPLSLSILKAFSCDAQHKALSKLTHLRPSHLKKFGQLISLYQQELRELLPKAPFPIKQSLKKFESSCLKLWQLHHKDLTQSLKLPAQTLQHFQELRNQANVLKSSLRMSIFDLNDVLNQLIEEQTFFDVQNPQLFFSFGIDHHYFSWKDFDLFKQHIETNPVPNHSKFKALSDKILQFKQAWFSHHKDWLHEGLKHYLEELSNEKHHTNNVGKPKLSITLFLHKQNLPEPHQSTYPSIGVEFFSEGPTAVGAHQRVVKSAGAGYDQIFKTYFKEFAAIAHRNIIIPKTKAPYMESFFRVPTDEASISPIKSSMLKNRFFNRSGLSTLFFFPCKTFESQKVLNHKF